MNCVIRGMQLPEQKAKISNAMVLSRLAVSGSMVSLYHKRARRLPEKQRLLTPPKTLNCPRDDLYSRSKPFGYKRQSGAKHIYSR